MKRILIAALVTFSLVACEKDKTPEAINVEGYWNIVNDKTFTAIATNSTADLFHLFKGPHAFYRLSYLKTQDFSQLNARPRNDSMIAYYNVNGNQLQIPNPAPSFANIIPGNNLLRKTNDEMVFTRFIIIRRSTITGEVVESRTDTITYQRVTDPAKVAYFDNYLKTYHK